MTPSHEIVPTPQQLRALTHPARLRMLGMLRVDGPATATTLAHALGLNTGATSYHLRQLAHHGFIEEDEERGTARERWWRASARSTHAVEPPEDDLEANDATDAYLQAVATIYAEQLQRSVEELPVLPRAWRAATTYSDWVVRVTPEQAERVTAAIQALLADLEEAADDDPAAASYVVQLNAYPRPGQLGEDR